MASRIASICAALALVTASLTVSGCTSGSHCFPQPLTASPESTVAGGRVTISSKPANCDLGYPADHVYRLQLSHRGVTAPTISTPVRSDGSFSATVDVPTDFPKGTAYVLVSGSTYDSCKDTGTGSCAGYATTFTIK